MTRPWVSPQQVKEYTEIKAVQNRADEKLEMDIARAEQYVITYTHNEFKDESYDTAIPKEVVLAIILLAEAYANQAIMAAKQSEVVMENGMKSETFDDYSYTVSDSASEFDVSSLNLSSLLDSYVIAQAKGKTILRMHKL